MKWEFKALLWAYGRKQGRRRDLVPWVAPVCVLLPVPGLPQVWRNQRQVVGDGCDLVLVLCGMSPGPSRSGTCTCLLPHPGRFGPAIALPPIFPHYGDGSGRTAQSCVTTLGSPDSPQAVAGEGRSAYHMVLNPQIYRCVPLLCNLSKCVETGRHHNLHNEWS